MSALQNNFPRVFTLLYLALVIFSYSAKAQKKTVKTTAAPASLLWEVSGKDLKQPSYLFGTFHLINSSFLTEHPVIEEKMQRAQAVVGEIIVDSTATMQVMAAGVMKGTTLDKLLSPEEYKRLGEYLKELSGYDIAMFNSVKPMMISSFLTVLEWQKMHPEQKATDPAMDMYFQQQAKKSGKKVLALETLEEQIKILFDGIPLERQAQLLVETTQDPESLKKEVQKMETCYRSQQLECLKALLFDSETYKPEEMALLLNQRNQKWMTQLPTIMRDQSAFIAVGAGHLVGESGLVTQLRKQGYTVKPISF